jgi:hypothetical protein
MSQNAFLAGVLRRLLFRHSDALAPKRGTLDVVRFQSEHGLRLASPVSLARRDCGVTMRVDRPWCSTLDPC